MGAMTVVTQTWPMPMGVAVTWATYTEDSQGLCETPSRKAHSGMRRWGATGERAGLPETGGDARPSPSGLLEGPGELWEASASLDSPVPQVSLDLGPTGTARAVAV